MNSSPNDIDHLLRATLDDFRLSRGERRALEATLKRWNVDQQQLAEFRSRAFDIARGELIDPSSHDVLGWLEEVVKALAAPPEPPASDDAEAYFTPGDGCLNAIVWSFRRAVRSADVCVFTITDDRITGPILDAHERGVKLRIITDNDKAFDPGSDIDRLRRAGVPLRVDQTEHHMHHKYALFDGRAVLTGSYNWTRGAAEYNDENLIVTSDARLVRKYQQHFEELWARLA